MIINVYNGFKDFVDIGGDILSRIKAAGLYDIFMPLEMEASDENLPFNNDKFNRMFFYVVLCYSFESEFIVMDADWDSIKLKVAERLNIHHQHDAQLYNSTVYLKSNAVVSCIEKYLEYQESEVFKHYMTARDLYKQFLNSSLQPILKSSGEVDYDQKKKNFDYANAMYKEVKFWGESLKNLKPELEPAKKEIKNIRESKSDPRKMNYENVLQEVKSE